MFSYMNISHYLLLVMLSTTDTLLWRQPSLCAGHPRRSLTCCSVTDRGCFDSESKFFSMPEG